VSVRVTDKVSRREFAAFALLASAAARDLAGAPGIEEALRATLTRNQIPAAVAAVATAEKVIYAGAFGKRDPSVGGALGMGSIFRIHSMTKPVTTVAAMQLVEQGKLSLDEPVANHIPALSRLDVLEGFDKEGKPLLRPARKPVLLRHLLTHTSGFAYDTWDQNILRYEQFRAANPAAATGSPPLMFDPGTRWKYGTNLDWTGLLVELVTGQTLEDYLRTNILDPLQMPDTVFSLTPSQFQRLVTTQARQTDGSLHAIPSPPPAASPSGGNFVTAAVDYLQSLKRRLQSTKHPALAPHHVFSGGGGLYSSAADYVRFLQMLLRSGRAPNNRQMLQPKTIELMTSNQIGELTAGSMKTVRPDQSADVDFHPGSLDKFGFGFLMNPAAYQGGRSAGSLTWAGLSNTFFWIDRSRGICAVLMMQVMPFFDSSAVAVLRDFERAVYSNI
jgi:methyl acetate hydrolase